jgi:predicted dehydrogenase
MILTGFNRRFSPAAIVARKILAGRRSPAIINYRMNAGFIPPDHWVHGEEGGGRNIGEACHIYDLFNFLVGARHKEVSATSLAPSSRQLRRDDNFVATIRYEDGSVCSLTYTALGSSAYPKEAMEIFVDGMVLALDDYKSLKTFGGSSSGWQGAAADKGHFAEMEALAVGLRTGDWPIPLADQIAATRISFLVQQQLYQ